MAAKQTETGKSETILREFALGYPETAEDFPWGHRVIKVKGKIFLMLSMGGTELEFSVKLPHSADAVLMIPFAAPTGYGLGKSGWVSCKLGAKEKAPLDLIKRWIDESYRAVAPKKLVATLPAREEPKKKPVKGTRSKS
jgi:predicted DNA-binding protein (MmcQ/YjbR family)